MRARYVGLLPLVLVLAASCIKLDEWEKYNKLPGAACATADECQSCPEGIDWECTGPTGDQGICQVGLCRLSKGEIGLNCTAEDPGTCDYSNCVYASAAEKGLCSKTCDDLSCPGERFACTQTNRQGGGVMNW
jgi:hypothetical protein